MYDNLYETQSQTNTSQQNTQESIVEKVKMIEIKQHGLFDACYGLRLKDIKGVEITLDFKQKYLAIVQ